MFRASRATTPVDVAWRLLTPLLAVLLVFSFEAMAPVPAEAASSGSGASPIRQRQLRAEATMLRADKQIKRLQQQRQRHEKRLKAAKRKLDKAIHRRNTVRGKLERTEGRLGDAERVLARAVRVRPNPKGTQAVDKPALRKQLRKLDSKVERLEKKTRKVVRKVERARKAKQARHKKVGKARVEARKDARERAEDRLGGAIKQMLDLSQARAGGDFRTASGTGFMKPAKGTISQRYGCTGYHVNPRRGSCAHFHDGIDIAARRGTKVRAAADGFVAYVGRNPWDNGNRAFVVIIGHAGGYESIYAHLQPRRKVRAGQWVERGDLIGFIGTTGQTSGPHVHWEVSRDFRSLNPLRAGR
ncbi:MAG: peptidoglycan DD-metalloendopeptidase family protein [Chloroflexota bacterium]|nr:peptidoglycan DD-metalloendopeptidase family protein [Chloroflexota bacterium]